MSQTDTIELRGFEDSDKAGRKKQNGSQKKRANILKERSITKGSDGQFVGEANENGEDKKSKDRSSPPNEKGASSPVTDKGAGGDDGSHNKQAGDAKAADSGLEASSDHLDFFLSSSIPKLLAVSYILVVVDKLRFFLLLHHLSELFQVFKIVH